MSSLSLLRKSTEPKEPSPDAPIMDALGELKVALNRIENCLALQVRMRMGKDSYSTEEIAKLVGRSQFQVRQWCLHGRIHATKRACGRGRTREWSISHEELTRLQNEGLLPAPKASTRL